VSRVSEKKAVRPWTAETWTWKGKALLSMLREQGKPDFWGGHEGGRGERKSVQGKK